MVVSVALDVGEAAAAAVAALLARRPVVPEISTPSMGCWPE